jgi:AraC-like DNA-binding protein
MGWIFVWLRRVTLNKQYLRSRAPDYLFGSLICFGASIYALADTPLFGNLIGDDSNILFYQKIAMFGVLSTIASFIHFLSNYHQKKYLVPTVDLICLILFLMCVFDFRFYLKDVVEYHFHLMDYTVKLHKPDIGYMLLLPLVFLVVTYSTYVFATAHFKKKYKYIGLLLLGILLMAILGIHDLSWGIGIIKNAYYPLFEFGVLAFIAGLSIKLIRDFLDAISEHESDKRHLEFEKSRLQSEKIRLQKEIMNFFEVSKDIEIQDNFIVRVSEILEQNIDDPNLHVQQLAKAMHMSTKTLLDNIKKRTGQHTTDFILNKRLELGAYLLKTTPYTIGQITYSVGLKNPNYFSRRFKQRYGMTPRQYRKPDLPATTSPA